MGLVAQCEQGKKGKVERLYSGEQAKGMFGEESLLSQMISLLFRNGASGVAAVAVEKEADYEGAFAALNQQEDLSVLLCDSAESSVQQKLKSAVEEASGLRKERIAVVFGAEGESEGDLIARAGALNSERVVLVGPEAVGDKGGARLAAAVAGAIVGETDPAVPLGGAVLRGIEGVSRSFGEEALDALIRGGVTVVETVSGDSMVIRGVTTRTKTGGSSDATWRELSTIRIVDDVIPTVRNALRSRFTRSKNTEQVRSAIRSQVVLELEEKRNREIITGYGEVATKAVADNPSVCLVEFSFTVAHGLNQIWLSAKITV